MPSWVLWVFLIGFSTIIVGIMLLAAAFFLSREGGVLGVVAIMFGIIGILVSHDFFCFVIWIAVFVFGTAAAAALMPERIRPKIGFVIVAVGFVVILTAVLTSFLALAFFGGLPVLFSGISVCVSGLPYWTRTHSDGNAIRRLKKSLYVILAVVIFSSAFVFSLRSTRFLREEIYDEWSSKTTADTTVRGTVEEIQLTQEVDIDDYSYHVFPAIIIVNVSEVVKVGESWSNPWSNLTEANEYWMNQNMIIAYDKPDIPSLAVGQRVEASGFYDTPVEDSWSYSFKLVVAAKIDGSYVESLRS